MSGQPQLRKIGIIASTGSGYELIAEYSDGSQSNLHGWYATKDRAHAAAVDFVLREYAPDADTYARGHATPADYGIEIEDWTGQATPD